MQGAEVVKVGEFKYLEVKQPKQQTELKDSTQEREEESAGRVGGDE